jgi:hypothetical protein
VLERHTASVTVFSYLEVPDETPPVADNVTLIETVVIDFLEEAFGPRLILLWGGGALTDDTDWHLYAVDAEGGPALPSRDGDYGAGA